ncbi:putative hexokinase-1 protein [Zalerion maritima]|uniref:Phosphotransferase n=1 Tax=Zalerion maritima TaxID=339359 RepID=A0AAD5RUW7_9PEZI|nr:putative hexokinase-1 protein [Zalerion maritima]
MTTVRGAIVAALKSFLRGKKMLVQAILAALWLTPSDEGRQKQPQLDPTATPPASSDGKRGAGRKKQQKAKQPTTTATTTIEAFLKEAESLLLGPVNSTDALRRLASDLKEQFRERMLKNPECMLPSYNSQLPSGFECGQYLSLDVGGSTLRVALVELKGRRKRAEKGLLVVEGEDLAEDRDKVSSRIVRIRSFYISPEIKAFEGLAFFDWMAKRIFETIQEDLPYDHSPDNPILMGLAWSFPLQQISLKSGLLQPMGKGFLAASGLINQDLGDLISFACRKLGLSVELRAIINDSSAALLSQAYLAPAATRFGLILGTGFNIAVHMPCSYIGRDKFGERPAEWFEDGSHVVVNTEMGMFGHGVLPLTRWDETLNSKHPKPGFQPLEHLVSGMYLGEVARYAILDSITTTGLLRGVVPEGLEKEYGFETGTMSVIESDDSPNLEASTTHFNITHPSSHPATTADIQAIRSLCNFISRRSAAMVAAAVYGLWDLRREAEATMPTPTLSSDSTAAEDYNTVPATVMDPVSQLPSPPSSSPVLSTIAPGSKSSSCCRAVVAYNGAVMERYPSYLQTCQSFLDALTMAEEDCSDMTLPSSKSGSGSGDSGIDLVEAKESSLLGAAVALASA